MELLVIGTLVAIVVSLGQALFSMTSGPTDSKRMVRALTVRVGLSIALFAFLMIGWYFGLIEPHGTGR
jgi:membrane associated rhomboid family serine protease